MANPNPNKRKPGDGRSVPLRAYLTEIQEELLRAQTKGMTTQQASREVARLILLGITMDTLKS